MNSGNSRYGTRRNGGAHGDVFTSLTVVSYMLDILGYTPDKDLSATRILEPSCGNGVFVMQIIRRLKESSHKYGFDLTEAFRNNVFAYDIDEEKIIICRRKVAETGINIPLDKNIIQADFLTETIDTFDAVVGNPPFVRYEQIPAGFIATYKKIFKTFHYRADLYVLFFEKTLNILNPGGKHCFICSNRWLKNEYGKKLRGLIAQSLRLESIISMERVENAFQENVLAYPAITLISNNTPASSFSFTELTSVEQLGDKNVTMLPTPNSSDWSSVFNQIELCDSLVTIEDMGFKLGIGVATGADSVFISKELPAKVENDLLIPSLNARDLTGNSLQWSGNYLLNPYRPDGELINLEDYPRASEYLSSRKDALLKRHVARKNPGKWYKTIDRIVPSLKDTPKILLPDISGNQMIFIDEGKFYPQHNLYYITGGSIRQLQILSAMLMTDFAKKQLFSITNCMNGGYPRWQSQYLRKLMLPDINTLEMPLADRIIKEYCNFNLDGLNEAMDTILSISSTNDSMKRHQVCQLSLAFS